MSKELVKKIQRAVGAGVDGIAGQETKALLWDYCDLKKLEAALPGLKAAEAAPAVQPARAPSRTASSGDPILDRITRILAIFEMGVPEFKWGDTYWYKDGPNRKRQCTLSMGFTEAGALQQVLDYYIENGGKNAAEVKKYRPSIGKYTVHLKKTEFSALMKKCGKEKVMQDAQLSVFNDKYLRRSEKFCKDNGFVTPLARLVFADSTLHSGTPALPFLRRRFSEVPPAKGGDEKAYVKRYSEVRRDWLAGHSNRLLNATAKRPRFYLKLMAQNNWQLDKKIVLEGHLI